MQSVLNAIALVYANEMQMGRGMVVYANEMTEGWWPMQMRCRWTQGVLNFQNKEVEKKKKKIWPKKSCHLLSAIQVSMSSK